MKILFDFYEIALDRGRSIGIYKYALAVLNTIGKNYPDIQIIVACNRSNVNDLENIPNIKVENISKAYPNFIQRLLWRIYKAISVCKKHKVDIYYSPKGFAPVLKKRKKAPFIVLTIHDMIPFYYLENYPKYFKQYDKLFITNSLKLSAITANKVITISQYSKKMILKYSNYPKGLNIDVIYNGVSCAKVNKNVSTHEVNPYIFVITSNLPHKNKENIIKGYIEYFENEVNPLRLIICGITEKDIDVPEHIKRFIDCLGFVDDETLSLLYLKSAFVLFLPHIEGFGFPPLEALHLNKISLVSDIPVLREILKDNAYYVDQNDSLAIANGIKSLAYQKEIANNILVNKNQILSQYTWEECCKQIILSFENTIKQPYNDKH